MIPIKTVPELRRSLRALQTAHSNITMASRLPASAVPPMVAAAAAIPGNAAQLAQRIAILEARIRCGDTTGEIARMVNEQGYSVDEAELVYRMDYGLEGGWPDDDA